MKKIAITALLCGCVATPVLAENLSPVYVEAGFGNATYEFQTSPRDLRLAAGLQFHPNWAVELGGSYLGGSTRLNKANFGGSQAYILGAKTLQLSLVGSYKINSDFDWVGKFGVTRNRANLGAINSQTQSLPRESRLYWAFGGDYHINKNFSVRGLYEDFGAIVGAVNASAVSLNLHYNF